LTIKLTKSESTTFHKGSHFFLQKKALVNAGRITCGIVFHHSSCDSI